MAKLTRTQFISALAPTAIRLRQEGSPLLPSVRLSQAILETGGVIHPWYNLGGIKVGNGAINAYWQGEAVNKGTKEYINERTVETRAAFRAYRSVYHFYKDQDLLFANHRYLRVREARTPEEQARMLQASGYATDPSYAAKLIALMNQHRLQQFDRLAQPLTKPEKLREATHVPVLYVGLVAAAGYLLNGTTWVAARRLGESLGAEVDWTGSKVLINGQELETILSEATGYVTARELAQVLGLRIEWDGEARAVLMWK